MRIRSFSAVALTALAFAGAACGEDNASDPNPSPGESDSPVNDDTPSANPEESTPAPNSESVQPDDGG